MPQSIHRFIDAAKSYLNNGTSSCIIKDLDMEIFKGERPVKEILHDYFRHNFVILHKMVCMPDNFSLGEFQAKYYGEHALPTIDLSMRRLTRRGWFKRVGSKPFRYHASGSWHKVIKKIISDEVPSEPAIDVKLECSVCGKAISIGYPEVVDKNDKVTKLTNITVAVCHACNRWVPITQKDLILKI